MLSYNLFLVYNSLSAAIHLYMIRALVYVERILISIFTKISAIIIQRRLTTLKVLMVGLFALTATTHSFFASNKRFFSENESL